MDGPQRNDYKADFLRELIKDFVNKDIVIHPNLLWDLLNEDENPSMEKCREAIHQRFESLKGYYFVWLGNNPYRHFVENAQKLEQFILNFITDSRSHYKLNYCIEDIKLTKNPKEFVYVDNDLPQFIFKTIDEKELDLKEVKKLQWIDNMNIIGLDKFQIQIIFGKRRTTEEQKEAYNEYCQLYHHDPLRGFPERPVCEYQHHNHCNYWRKNVK